MAIGSMRKKILTWASIPLFLLSSIMPSKALAKNVFDGNFDVDYRVAGVLYPKSQNPKTSIRVKVDLDKTDDNEYDLGISFFTKGWDEKKRDFWEYVLINGNGSRLCLAHPKNISIDDVEEEVYAVKMDSAKDKYMSGFWEEVLSLEDSTEIRFKMKVIEKAADFFSLFGLGKGMHYLTEIGEFKPISSKCAREIFEKMGKDNVKYKEVPFYPHNFRNITARKFKIPLYARKKAEKESVYVLLNVNLIGGVINNESYGSLENLMIEVPIGEEKPEEVKKVERFIQKNMNASYAEFIPSDNKRKDKIIWGVNYSKESEEFPDNSKIFIFKEINGELKKEGEIDFPSRLINRVKSDDFNNDGMDDIKVDSYRDRVYYSNKSEIFYYKNGDYIKSLEE